MKHVIICKSKKLKFDGCINTNIIVNHHCFMSESLMRRIDRELNKTFPKIFYKVEPIREKERFGVKIRIWDDRTSDIIKEVLTPIRKLWSVERELHTSREGD